MNSFKFSQRLLGRTASLAALAALAASSSFAASITFAQYFQTNGAQQQWSITTAGSTTTVTASGSVFFAFSGVSVPFAGPETANFSLSATSTQVGNCGVNCGAGDSYVQPGYAGSFSFTNAGSMPGSNMLSGVFAVTGSPATTGAQFSSSVGGSGGSFNASATAGNLLQLVMSSDFLSFVGQDTQNASWSLSSLIPNFTTGVPVGNQAFPGEQFNASGTGTFSSSPGPSAVPEPASMTLMGGGLVMVAWFGRRRFKTAEIGK
jgi:hypothetical protein